MVEKRFRVLIVDDHGIIRDLFKRVVESEDDLSFVGEAQTGKEAIEQCRDLSPDVVLMDIDLPDMNGIEATRRIMKNQPETRVLAFSVHKDERVISEMFGAGAMGYLPKDARLDELLHALRVVAGNQVYISPQIADLVVRSFASAGSVSGPFKQLSPRELQVTRLLCKGKTPKEIGYELKLSTKTVHAHRSNIMKKLDLGSIAELTKLAVREGIVSLED